MRIRRLTHSGQELYRAWLSQRSLGESPPTSLLDSVEHTEVAFDLEVDLTKIFLNRFEFGQYIAAVLDGQDSHQLLSSKNDATWDWLTVAYFGQFGKKKSKFWHYAVTRKGHAGSLTYRHLARTSYEMFWRHGPASFLILRAEMGTWGDLSEALTSRQNIAHHLAYFRTANALYLVNGKPVAGATNKVKPLKVRKVGDTTGKGGARRLALAVRRLCRTYDTHVLTTPDMLAVLPREFRSFAAKSSFGAEKAVETASK